jgi:hypothetical protein
LRAPDFSALPFIRFFEQFLRRRFYYFPAKRPSCFICQKLKAKISRPDFLQFEIVFQPHGEAKFSARKVS